MLAKISQVTLDLSNATGLNRACKRTARFTAHRRTHSPSKKFERASPAGIRRMRDDRECESWRPALNVSQDGISFARGHAPQQGSIGRINGLSVLLIVKSLCRQMLCQLQKIDCRTNSCMLNAVLRAGDFNGCVKTPDKKLLFKRI